MSRVSNNIKFGKFMEIIKQETNKDQDLTSREIIDKLRKYGISIDRRAVYKYVKDMKDLGYDVKSPSKKYKGYRLITKSLDKSEIRVISDAIASSRFIPLGMSEDLIKKISNLNTLNLDYEMKRYLFIDDRVKHNNEQIFENIDKIYNAINEKKKIAFNYYDIDKEMKLVPRKDKYGEIKRYIVSPVSVILKSENYYLILADDKHSDLSNYRIDKIKNVQILGSNIRDLSEIGDCKNGFNVSLYSKKSFKMFPGVDSIITINFRKNLFNFMIDSFGRDIEIIEMEDGTYNGIFVAKIGSGLVNWILQLGSDGQVRSPEFLKEMVINEISKVYSLYK